MKAALCRAFGEPLTIEEVVLRAPGPGEVQVAIEAVAICHSDLGYIDGIWASQLPAVYGHEAAGRITALGRGPGTRAGRCGRRVDDPFLRAMSGLSHRQALPLRRAL